MLLPVHHLIGRPCASTPAVHQPSERPGSPSPVCQPELRIAPAGPAPPAPAMAVQRLTGLLLPLLRLLPQPCILLPQAPQPPIQDLLHPGVEVRLVPARGSAPQNPPAPRRREPYRPSVRPPPTGRSRLCKPLPVHPNLLHGDTLLSVVGHDPICNSPPRSTHWGYCAASCASPHRTSCQLLPARPLAPPPSHSPGRITTSRRFSLLPQAADQGKYQRRCRCAHDVLSLGSIPGVTHHRHPVPSEYRPDHRGLTASWVC